MVKKFFILLICVAMLSGCGIVESWYDQANYESLTNESGTIEILSGGKVVYRYENAEVKYSSADTDAVWFETQDGHEKYAQPGLIIHLED